MAQTINIHIHMPREEYLGRQPALKDRETIVLIGSPTSLQVLDHVTQSVYFTKSLAAGLEFQRGYSYEKFITVRNRRIENSLQAVMGYQGSTKPTKYRQPNTVSEVTIVAPAEIRNKELYRADQGAPHRIRFEQLEPRYANDSHNRLRQLIREALHPDTGSELMPGYSYAVSELWNKHKVKP